MSIQMRSFAALTLGLGLLGQPAMAQSVPAYQSAFTEEETVFYDIDTEQLTSSEQQLIVRAHILASPEVVFERMTDHERLQEWMPGVERLVSIDHTASVTPGATNVGSVRTAVFFNDTVSEEFQGWVPGKAWAYSVEDSPGGPITDHLGLLTFEDDGAGGSYLTWRQYFEPLGLKGRLIPFVMHRVMKRALKNIAAEYGGELIRPGQARRATED